MSVNCIYVAASSKDGRYTRICVASIRHFYPDTPIRLLVGGPLEKGLAEELERYWQVGVEDLPPGDYGWGFVKLEPLFRRPGERFLVLDSDTVLTGPVLLMGEACDAPFVVDDEAQSEEDLRRLYYDWRALAQVEPATQPPRFVFNSGQWFGTGGVLAREDFAALIDWSMPPKLRWPEHFMPGDQGVLNYMLNQKAALDGLEVARRKIMRWPGHGLEGLSAQTVKARTAPPLVIHWAGMKKARLGAMAGSDILRFYEKAYYRKLPLGGIRRIANGCRHTLSELQHTFRTRVRLFLRRLKR